MQKKLTPQFCLLSAFLLLAIGGCDRSAPIPTGYARVTGYFPKSMYADGNDTVQYICVTQLTSTVIKPCKLTKNGLFEVEVPVVCPTEFQIAKDSIAFVLYIYPGKETKFKLITDTAKNISLQMIRGNGYFGKDFNTLMDWDNGIYWDVFHELLMSSWSQDSITSADNFNEKVKNNLIQMDSIWQNADIDDSFKPILSKNMKIAFLERLLGGYYYKHPLKTVSDYAFLDNYNLTDSLTVRELNDYNIIKMILRDSVLNIPPIEEIEVEDWINQAQSILSKIIKSKSALFYDLLAANSYNLQFINDLRPLSEKQISNINSYFGNTSFATILLAENERIIEVSKVREKETPDVFIDQLIDTIVAGHKGKVVVIDFWAIWCGPCLRAMTDSRELKKELEKKGVDFIYIADDSSDRPSWRRKVWEIGGEHYYLTGIEMNYLSDIYGIRGIPFYMIYDKTGKLHKKLISYPGNEKMREIIEELLEK